MTSPFEIGEFDDVQVNGSNDETENEESNQHSLPNPEELKMDNPSRGWGPLFSTLVTIFLVLVLAVGIALIVVQPFRDPEREAMIDYLVKEGISSRSSFSSRESAQSKAVTFLLKKDLMALETPETGFDTTAGHTFVQRYVLTVFYYALHGESWDYDAYFLSANKACYWYEQSIGMGVICDTNERLNGLVFQNNGLVGSLPSELGALTTLKHFRALGNSINGLIPDRYQELTNLVSFIVGFNQIRGTIPSWIGNWEDLSYLYLSNNEFEGSVPTSVASLTELTVVALDDNSLTGSMDFVWSLPKLQYLYMDSNSFTGELPSSLLSTNPLLEVLDVSGNKIEGTLPDDLFQLTKLGVIDVSDNSLTGSIPSEFLSDNVALYFFAAQKNLLEEAIPTEIGMLKRLSHLDLSSNELEGLIPEEIGELTFLTYLFLAENRYFTNATIPDFLYSLSNLEELSLKGTQRTGEISELVEFWSNLILLDLDDNELTGPIPSEIGSMTNLEFLLLNRNELTGSIPSTFANLLSLRFLLMDENSLTGTLNVCPASDSLELAIQDCVVQCTCCDVCCEEDEDCHSYDLVANSESSWENDYERVTFDFSSDSGYFSVDDDEGR